MAQSQAAVPASGAHSRGSFLRTALGAALGVLAVVGIIAIAVAVAFATGVFGTSAHYKDVHAPYGVGASALVKTAGSIQARATIDKIDDPATNINPFEFAAGKHWLRYVVTIENVGKSESAGADFILRTTDGFEYKPQVAIGLGAGDLKGLQRLTPGGKVSMTIAFQVPDKTAVQWLRFDPNIFASGDLYFEKQ